MLVTECCIKEVVHSARLRIIMRVGIGSLNGTLSAKKIFNDTFLT